MGGPRTADPVDDGSAGTPTRHTAVNFGTENERGVLALRECGLLVPMGTVVDPFDAEDPGSKGGNRSTGEQARQDRREPEQGGKTQQRMLPARGMRVARDKGSGSPERSCALNACGHQRGGKRGGPPT